jgi:hypothetical protein
MHRAVGRGNLLPVLLVACLADGGSTGGYGLIRAHTGFGQCERRAGPWRLRGGGSRGGDARDDERERIVTASILKQLTQTGGADSSAGAKKMGVKSKNAGLPRDRAEGQVETFESDGLEFRRTINDDPEYLLQQMREGRLGEDPLERAREFMDSDEVDDLRVPKP